MGASYSSCNSDLYINNEQALVMIDNEATQIMNLILCKNCNERQDFAMNIGYEKINELNNLFNVCALQFVTTQLGIRSCLDNKKRMAVDIVNFYLDKVNNHIAYYNSQGLMSPPSNCNPCETQVVSNPCETQVVSNPCQTQVVSNPCQTQVYQNTPCETQVYSMPSVEQNMIDPNIYDELYQKMNEETNNTQALVEMYNKMKANNDAIRRKYESMQSQLDNMNSQNFDMEDAINGLPNGLPNDPLAPSNMSDNFLNTSQTGNSFSNVSDDQLSALEKEVEAESRIERSVNLPSPVVYSSTGSQGSIRSINSLSDSNSQMDPPFPYATMPRTEKSVSNISVLQPRVSSTIPSIPVLRNSSPTFNSVAPVIRRSITTQSYSPAVGPVVQRTTTTQSYSPAIAPVVSRTVTQLPMSPRLPTSLRSPVIQKTTTIQSVAPMSPQFPTSPRPPMVSKTTTTQVYPPILPTVNNTENSVHTVIREVPITHRTIYKPVITKREVVNEPLPEEIPMSPRPTTTIIREVAPIAPVVPVHTHTHTETVIREPKKELPIIPVNRGPQMVTSTPIVTNPAVITSPITLGQKSIHVKGESIRNEGGRVIVTNPQTVEVTHTVHKSQLGSLQQSLPSNTRIVKIEPVMAPKVSRVITTPIVTAPIVTAPISGATPVRAIADHVPTSSVEVPLREGQATSYIRPGARGWAYVRHADGSEGYVPSSHLSL
jgi:hypothetical protein